MRRVTRMVCSFRLLSKRPLVCTYPLCSHCITDCLRASTCCVPRFLYHPSILPAATTLIICLFLYVGLDAFSLIIAYTYVVYGHLLRSEAACTSIRILANLSISVMMLVYCVSFIGCPLPSCMCHTSPMHLCLSILVFKSNCLE